MPRCDFCGSVMVRWRYSSGDRSWRACDKCRDSVDAEDHDGLVRRALQKPLPRSVPQSFAARHEDGARRIVEEFWTLETGPPAPF